MLMVLCWPKVLVHDGWEMNLTHKHSEAALSQDPCPEHRGAGREPPSGASQQCAPVGAGRKQLRFPEVPASSSAQAALPSWSFYFLSLLQSVFFFF